MNFQQYLTQETPSLGNIVELLLSDCACINKRDKDSDGFYSYNVALPWKGQRLWYVWMPRVSNNLKTPHPTTGKLRSSCFYLDASQEPKHT
jgi:hypothetical protein